MPIFLDSNIFFSAVWKEDTHALLLFELAEVRHCLETKSQLAVEEARRNIARKRLER